MSTTVTYAPGIQNSSSTNIATQCRDIAHAKPNVRIVLDANHTVTIAQFLAITPARLRQLGINEQNTWSLLDDVADGQTIDPRAADLSARYGTSGSVDGTYDRAVLVRPGGEIDVHEALSSDRFSTVRDPVSLATSLVAAHGQALRAILGLPNGQQILRQGISDARPSTVLPADWSRLSAGLFASITDQALCVHTTVDSRLAGVRYSGQAARLNQISSGDSMASAGDSGFFVTVIQRYLQVYNPGEMARTTGTFDAATVDQVTRFQVAHQLPASGRVDAATLQALLLSLPSSDALRTLAPTDPRFTIEMDLNQPSHGNDGTWTATRAWNDDDKAAFVVFMRAYMRACLDTKEQIDCADLAYETLVTFARQRRLPIVLTDGHQTIRNDSCPQPTAVSSYAREMLRAIHLPLNTVPVPIANFGPGVIPVMDWTQDGNRSFPYQHTFNVIIWDASNPARTLAIYGDEGDTVRPSVLAAFNTQFGTHLIADDIPEHTMIDAINDDTPGHVRQMPAAMWPQIVGELFDGKGYFAGDAAKRQRAITAFIAMLRNTGNITRNGSTPVRAGEGEGVRSQILGPCLWADGPLLLAAQRTVNSEFHLTVGAGQSGSGTRPEVSADILQVLRNASEEDELAAARLVVRRRGATDANAESAAARLVALVDAARQGRSWNIAAFNRNVATPRHG